MKFPNKVISFQDSVLSKLTLLLDALSKKDLLLVELYLDTRKSFLDLREFIDAIDCLFALNKLEYNKDLEMLHYVS